MKRLLVLFAILSLLLSGCGDQSDVSESVYADQTSTIDNASASDGQVTTEVSEQAGDLSNKESAATAKEEGKVSDEYKITVSTNPFLYTEFSEGLAWTCFSSNDNEYYVGVIDEDGKLIFMETEEKIRDILGGYDIHNTLFQDGLSSLYTNDSYLIINKNGDILHYKLGDEYEKYVMLGYETGEFLVTKEDYDGFDAETQHFYAIDEKGNVLSKTAYVASGFVGNQHFVSLGRGVFADRNYFYDLNEGICVDFSSGSTFGSTKGFLNPITQTVSKELFLSAYPMMRAFDYYEDHLGFELREMVYLSDYIDDYDVRHCAFCDLEGKVLIDIDEKNLGMRIVEIGLYSKGHIPLLLMDENENLYITVASIQGDLLYQPLKCDDYGIAGFNRISSYNGYVGVTLSHNARFAILTPTGEIKYIGDDLSEMGSDACMYGEDGCFIAEGYMFGMNHASGLDTLYSRNGECLNDAYISLDGKKVIGKAYKTNATKNMGQLSNLSTYEERTSVSRLEKAFQGTSAQFNIETAKLAAVFSEASEEKSPYKIENAYNEYGIQNVKSYNYDLDIIGGGASSFGRAKVIIDGVETDLLFITCRGTKTLAEIMGDGLFWSNISYFLDEYLVWQHNYDFYEKTMSAFEDYLKNNSDLLTTEHLKIFVNGHSLGGAAACMVGAWFDKSMERKALFNKNVTKDDVFVYTFGTIKTLTTDVNIATGYENIHNIYNEYDAFGPKGKEAITFASSPEGKFGHTELFALDYDKDNGLLSFENHNMSTYRDALEREDIKSGFLSLACAKGGW